MVRVLAVVAALLASAGAIAHPQSDLDALMARVLAQRDGNWKKLQQYVLNERETLQVTGPGGQPVYGFRREYLWYPRDPSTPPPPGAGPSTALGAGPSTALGAGSRFVRSPLTADGVTIGEAERIDAERQWIERDERRSRRGDEPLEPGFVSAAYFLNFRFEPGHYALVGREILEDRGVLRIEYYPAQMFREGRTRPNRRIRERDEDAGRKMNKTSMVTLWVAPDEHQIVRYEFENIDMDFLPAQPVLRFEGATATMEMGQPFPDVWLPKTLTVGFDLTLASGEVKGRYSAEYYDYRLASVTTRLRP